jgi:hypothetical protein
MTPRIPFRTAALALALALPAAAHADCIPDSVVSSQSTITDPTFGAYTVEKTVTVYSADNCGNPLPVAGQFTYVYTVKVLPDSTIGILNFVIPIPSSGSVSQWTFIDGAGVNPTNIVKVSSSVTWDFGPNGINPGEMSGQLVLVSPYAPGGNVASVGGQFGLDANGNCLGPVLAPEPITCTIGFWKNREAGKKGLLQYFPGTDWDAVKAEAVAISSVFSTVAELEAALTSSGARTVEERAKQQLAALLLNVAAGSLYPANTKCRVFLGANGTQIDLDGNGAADITLEAALTQIESDILSGDPALQQAAQELADDINNGVGVLRDDDL